MKKKKLHTEITAVNTDSYVLAGAFYDCLYAALLLCFGAVASLYIINGNRYRDSAIL